MLSIGVWALNEKNVFSNISSKIFLQDPAFFGIIFGSIAFIIGEYHQGIFDEFSEFTEVNKFGQLELWPQCLIVLGISCWK